MARIGVTGHVVLADGTAELVYARLTEELRPYSVPELHGITCLADGADQLFARAVLACGGTYEVVIPATDYRHRAVGADNLAAFDDLLGRATTVSYMPFQRSGRDAYLAASLEMLRRCERLFAVWDGNPSARIGDTADVVRVAQSRRLPVTVLWPAGARRR